MLSNLLEEAANTASWKSNIGSIVFIVLIVAAFIAMMVFNSRSQKKRQQESQKMLDAIKPGSKVKTIGGICGIVVEVNAEENTFILETGSLQSGKSYIKFDKQAVYQTDAVPEEEKPTAAPAEKPEENVAESAPVEENAENEENK